MGTEHYDWLAFAKGVIARTEQARSGSGEYPYIFSEETGAGLEYDSFSGAWCLAAAALFCRLTGERSWLPGLLKSEAWYHETWIRRETCWGGPLDIDKNIDSEGILSYIRAVRDLHGVLCLDHPGNTAAQEMLLDHLRDALYYEFLFKFCYNSPVKVPPLSTVGWSSCGGSITSVTNPHIHPMSSSVIDEMKYYLRFREDSYVRGRLEDTVLWSCQCHNTRDGEFGYGKTGWMSERFCHSEGLLTETWPDGSPASTWFALMPWACGSILEGLTGDAWQDDQAVIHVYTRPVNAENYPEGLANSVHLAFEAKDTGIVPFNKNYGILFAEGRVSEANTIVPLGVRSPGIFRTEDGSIMICAERIHENGRADETASGKLLLWKTRDLIHFESAGLAEADALPPGRVSGSLTVQPRFGGNRAAMVESGRLHRNQRSGKYPGKQPAGAEPRPGACPLQRLFRSGKEDLLGSGVPPFRLFRLLHRAGNRIAAVLPLSVGQRLRGSRSLPLGGKVVLHLHQR